MGENVAEWGIEQWIVYVVYVINMFLNQELRNMWLSTSDTSFAKLLVKHFPFYIPSAVVLSTYFYVSHSHNIFFYFKIFLIIQHA